MPHPFGHKLYAHLRPYLVEGPREMICEGYYREALGWTMAFYSSSMQIIQIDAPSKLTPDMQAKFGECMRQFGLDGAIPWEDGIKRAQELFHEIFMPADEIIASNPLNSSDSGALSVMGSAMRRVTIEPQIVTGE